MNIVVLDGHTLNPGDLTWDTLTELGSVTIHARTPPERVLERSRDADILLTNKTVLNRRHVEQLPQLKYIGVLATGYNVVDTDAARERGVTVTNIPAYGTPSVAQLVFAHLLHHCHRLAEHAQGVRDGKWCAAPDFCYHDFPLIELADRTMGLIGFGRIGQAVARIALAFGMKAVAHDNALSRSPVEGVEMAPLDDVLSRSDVLSLHCPLTPQTEKLINANSLKKMKRHAFLINTGRGPLVDETALAEALNAGLIGGAGLDVLTSEPPPPDNPLLRAKNCFITPHIAWATLAARRRLMDIAVENVRAFLAGQPRNTV